MFGLVSKSSLDKAVSFFESRIYELETRIWKLENPPKYLEGQKTKHGMCVNSYIHYKEDYSIYGMYKERVWHYIFKNGNETITITT